MASYGVKVTGVGSYAPEKVLTNKDIEKMVDTSDEWITARTGIKERHIAAPHQAASDLAFEAAKGALEMAGIEGKDLDFIVVATVLPDMPFPSTACFLQEKLGAKNAAGVDVEAGCSGFLYAFHLANALVASGAHKKVLIVAAEILSRILDWTDRSTCVLLGDGAGAVVMERAEEGDPQVLSSHVGSDGSQWDLLYMPGGGSRNPTSAQTIEDRLHFFKMNGAATFRQAVGIMEGASLRAMEEAGITMDQVDLFIPHQANYRIITALADHMNFPLEKIAVTVHKYGNTSAATVPMALDEYVRSGRIKRGDTVLIAAFGAGLTWGSAVLKWA